MDLLRRLPGAGAKFQGARVIASLIGGLLLTVTAQAQVQKCTDPHTGKISYTDGACPSATNAMQVEGAKSADAISLERERAQLARERFELQQQRNAVNRATEPAPQVVAPVGRVDSYQCEVAKRNLGVGANPESKKRSEQAYETACFGDKAADIQQAREGRAVINQRTIVTSPTAPQRPMFCDKSGWCN